LPGVIRIKRALKKAMSKKMTNKTSIVLLALLIGAPLLGGCTSQESNVFGEEKRSPDEFAVYSRAPLSLPPDFGLRPPKPGAGRPQTLTPRNDARDALLSNSGVGAANSVPPAPQAESEQTPGIRALLENTGANQANPDIRSLVNNETAALSGTNDESFADNILFWRQTTGLKGAIINPAVEERRMRKAQAAGNVNEEAPAPTIQRSGDGGGSPRDGDEPGFWGSLFD
jgi:hypothetical protein